MYLKNSRFKCEFKYELKGISECQPTLNKKIMSLHIKRTDTNK